MRSLFLAGSVAVVAVCTTMVVDRSAQGQAPGGGPFIGQMMTTGANFCPPGWYPASGQLLPIKLYMPLFSLLGTTYGGDGKTNFALPYPKPVPMESGGTLTHCIAYQGAFPPHT
jgi:microcystin-dependent protein